MADIKIVMTDLDGTFMHSIFNPFPENVEAMHKSQAKGVPVVAVTARNYNCASKLFRAAGFQGHVIINNGSAIHDAQTGETLWENAIPDPWLYEALRLSMEHCGVMEAYTSNEAVIYKKLPGYNPFYQREDEADVDPSLQRTRRFVESIDEMMNILSGHGQLVRVRFPNNEGPGSYYESLCRAGEFLITTSNPGIMEIMAAGSGKRGGCQQLARMLNIAPENVMTIGDQYNDVGMIIWAGIGVAVGSAKERVKELADYVSLPFDQGGVAHAIEKFVLNV
ncbi:MAG: HAD family phosphatase [Clostridia bacterium]|nr:HAD family phosphatase [Clostridia bacterium]